MKILVSVLMFCISFVFAQVSDFKAPVPVMADGKKIAESSLHSEGALSPGLYDYDDDGDIDLFVGTFVPPKLIYYENIGTPKNPVFTERGYVKSSNGNDVSTSNW